MIDEETKRKLRGLNLDAAVDIIAAQDRESGIQLKSFDDRMKEIVDYVYQVKNTEHIERLKKRAKFRYPRADITEIIYDQRAFKPQTITELATCSYMNTSTNLVLQGYTGLGKTWLACALGKEACNRMYRTKYIRGPDLLNEYIDALEISNKQGEKVLDKYGKYDLLILDEWLLDDLTPKEEYFIFELVERRVDISSTILCTQYRREDWQERLHADARGDAITNRLSNNAIWLEMGKADMREYNARKLNLK